MTMAFEGRIEAAGIPHLRLGWLFLLAASLPLGHYRRPDGETRIHDRFAGIVVALFFGYWPQIVLGTWLILVIILWLLQSMYVWKRGFPPFRIGIWIGFGLMSGFWLGFLFGHIAL